MAPVSRQLDQLFEQQAQALSEFGVGEAELTTAGNVLTQLLRYWSTPEQFRTI